MEIDYFEMTHIGARASNQDYCAHRFFENAACFAMADGLGGHPHGEVAARIICETLMMRVPEWKRQSEDPQQVMEQWITQAGQDFRQALIKEVGMVDAHTTLVVVWLDPQQTLIAHVGDSRLYRITLSPFHVWRTADHTPVQALFEKGGMTEDAFLAHPLQNCVLRTVNINDTPKPDIVVQPPLTPNETLILCTDGLWSYCQQKDLQAFCDPITGNEAIEQKIENIIGHVSHADNITVQKIRLKAC